MVRLGDVCEILAGDSAPQDKTFFENGIYPFVRTSDVGVIHVGKLTKTRDLLNEDGVKRLRCFPKGSILFPKSGASTFLNHRVILGIDAYVASHLAVIIPSDKVSNYYLLYLLQTVDSRQLQQSADYPSLRLLEIAEVQFPLPPLAVQREIVARLEKELGEAEKVAAKFKRLAELADETFKAELDETFNTIEGEKVRLGDVCETVSTRGHQIKQSEIRPVGRYPVVSQSENLIEGYSDSEIALYEDEIVLFGDHTCCVKLIDFPFIVGADGVKLLKSRDVISKCLAYVLNHIRSKIVDGKYRRHFGDLVEQKCPLPPLAVQREIVAKLDAAKERCEKLKTAALRGLAAAENLRKAILAEAFQ